MTPRPLSPKEKQEHGYLLGKGVYSGLQLKNLLLGGMPKDDEEEKFVVKIPKEKLKHVKESSLQNHALIIGNVWKGFTDKEKEHYDFRKKNLEKELEKAQHRYVTTLTQKKEASLKKEATPNVDALCLGMLSVLEKAAAETISDGSLKRSLKNMVHPITKHLPTPHKIKEDYWDPAVLASTLGAWMVRSNMNKEEAKAVKKPLNVQIEAI